MCDDTDNGKNLSLVLKNYKTNIFITNLYFCNSVVHSKGGHLHPKFFKCVILSCMCVCVCGAERWKLGQAMEVKKLPLKAQVISTYDTVEEPKVHMVGEEVQLTRVDEEVFLRANCINDGRAPTGTRTNMYDLVLLRSFSPKQYEYSQLCLEPEISLHITDLHLCQASY